MPLLTETLQTNLAQHRAKYIALGMALIAIGILASIPDAVLCSAGLSRRHPLCTLPVQTEKRGCPSGDCF